MYSKQCLGFPFPHFPVNCSNAVQKMQRKLHTIGSKPQSIYVHTTVVSVGLSAVLVVCMRCGCRSPLHNFHHHQDRRKSGGDRGGLVGYRVHSPFALHSLYWCSLIVGLGPFFFAYNVVFLCSMFYSIFVDILYFFCSFFKFVLLDGDG